MRNPEYMRLLAPTINRCMGRLERRIKDKPNANVRLCKIKQVAELLLANWDSEVRLKEADIAEQCPLLGCHAMEERRIPEVRQDQSTLRQVRALTRAMRVEFGFPLLSDWRVKGCGKNRDDLAGYWFSRSKKEADEYVKREAPSIIATQMACDDRFVAMANVLRSRRYVAAFRVHRDLLAGRLRHMNVRMD